MVPQYTVCHSKSKAHTFFSSHVLHGRALASNNADGPRPSNFKEGKGFFTTSSPSNAYSLKTQKDTFILLLGQESAQKYFSTKKNFLAKGHLAPDADFVYQEWQDASYYFFNVAPQVKSKLFHSRKFSNLKSYFIIIINMNSSVILFSFSGNPLTMVTGNLSSHWYANFRRQPKRS